jgi:hypothetical protein
VLCQRGEKKEIGSQRDVTLGVRNQVRILGVVVVGSEKMKSDPLYFESCQKFRER